MNKKILILAGTHFQVPVIRYAKSAGHFVITCDNIPENPGHRFSDKYYNVSTTDLNGILEIARKEEINGILAYASDIAANAAAYVSEKMRIPGNSFNAVIKLTDKGLFRDFLAKNGFPVPEFSVITNLKEAETYRRKINGSVFIKPVDSSGSKGVTKICKDESMGKALEYAMSYSKKKELIIEKGIEFKGPQIHGEAFIYKGELKFMLLGDQFFSRINPCAPVSTTLPGLSNENTHDQIGRMLCRLLSLVGFHTGGLNIEVIKGIDDKIYFIEIGPRSGGNFMPELAQLATGFDLAYANVNAVLGDPVDFIFHRKEGHFYTQVILHSSSDGKYLNIAIPESFKKNEKFRIIYYNKGDKINKYCGSSNVIGVILYEFDNHAECKSLINFITSKDLVVIN